MDKIEVGKRYVIEAIGEGSSKWSQRQNWIGLEVEIVRVDPFCRAKGYHAVSATICEGQGELLGEPRNYGTSTPVPFPEVGLSPIPPVHQSADLAWSDFLDQLNTAEEGWDDAHEFWAKVAFKAGYEAGMDDRKK